MGWGLGSDTQLCTFLDSFLICGLETMATAEGC